MKYYSGPEMVVMKMMLIVTISVTSNMSRFYLHISIS
jgi:hypothetical protein